MKCKQCWFNQCVPSGSGHCGDVESLPSRETIAAAVIWSTEPSGCCTTNTEARSENTALHQPLLASHWFPSFIDFQRSEKMIIKQSIIVSSWKSTYSSSAWPSLTLTICWLLFFAMNHLKTTRCRTVTFTWYTQANRPCQNKCEHLDRPPRPTTTGCVGESQLSVTWYASLSLGIITPYSGGPVTL
jgi:hypothetical protein